MIEGGPGAGIGRAVEAEGLRQAEVWITLASCFEDG